MNASDIHDRAADGAVAMAAVSAGISLQATLQVVQIIAGLVAIVSGLCACFYYIKKANTQ